MKMIRICKSLFEIYALYGINVHFVFCECILGDKKLFGLTENKIFAFLM